MIASGPASPMSPVPLANGKIVGPETTPPFANGTNPLGPKTFPSSLLTNCLMPSAIGAANCFAKRSCATFARTLEAKLRSASPRSAVPLRTEAKALLSSFSTVSAMPWTSCVNGSNLAFRSSRARV